MPPRALRVCPIPGCAELTRDRYCQQHMRERQKAVDSKRPNYRERGYSNEWDKARRHYLKENPLCVVCGGKANTVDHINPHKGDKRLFWDKSNWQSMCRKHHSQKTAKVDGGFGNSHVY